MFKRDCKATEENQKTERAEVAFIPDQDDERLGHYSPTEDARIMPFLKDAIMTQ